MDDDVGTDARTDPDPPVPAGSAAGTDPTLAEPVDRDAAADDGWTHSASLDPLAVRQARDAEFTLFYDIEMPKLVGFLIVQGASVMTAADAAQEAMTSAYRQWDDIDQPRAWVRTVAARTVRRFTERARKEAPHGEPPEPGHGLLTAQSAAEVEARHTFLALLRQLPPAQREVLAWTYDGYTPTQIAAVLGKKPATVRSVLRDARAALQRQYPNPEELT